MSTRRIRSRVVSYRLGHIRLYRDDMEQIARVIEEVGKFKAFCDDWELTTSSDFRDATLPEALTGVEIIAKSDDGSTRIKVKLNSVAAVVVLIEPDTLTLGALGRIRQIAKQRQRFWRVGPGARWIAVGGALTFGALAAGSTAAFANMPLHQSTVTRTLTWSFTALVWVASVIFLIIPPPWRTCSSAILVNADFVERPSFWRRTRDDWVIGVVMALVGGVLGYVVNALS